MYKPTLLDKPSGEVLAKVSINPHSFAGLEFKPSETIKKRQTNDEKVAIIKQLIFKYHGINFDQADVWSRKREFVNARFQFMYFVDLFTNLHLRQIGNEFLPGRKKPMDHSSIIHGKRTWQNVIDTEPAQMRMHKEFLADLKTLIF